MTKLIILAFLATFFVISAASAHHCNPTKSDYVCCLTRVC